MLQERFADLVRHHRPTLCQNTAMMPSNEKTVRESRLNARRLDQASGVASD
jgi:hypothetical protein